MKKKLKCSGQMSELNLEWKVVDKELFKTHRYKPIEEVIESYDIKLSEKEYPRIRQNTEASKKLRENLTSLKKYKVYGSSSIATMLGLHTYHAYQYFGETRKPDRQAIVELSNTINKKKEINEFQSIFMKWGTLHEDNGIAAVLLKFNEISVKEAGSYFMDTKYEDLKLIVSPDGFFEFENGNTGTLEIKCPSPLIVKNEEFRYVARKPWDNIKFYYVPQIQLQMWATGKKKSCFVCYTATRGTKFYFVDYNEAYVNLIIEGIKWTIDNYYNKELADIPDDPHKKWNKYEKFLKETKMLSMKFESHFLETIEFDILPYNPEWIFKEEKEEDKKEEKEEDKKEEKEEEEKNKNKKRKLENEEEKKENSNKKIKTE